MESLVLQTKMEENSNLRSNTVGLSTTRETAWIKIVNLSVNALAVIHLITDFATARKRKPMQDERIISLLSLHNCKILKFKLSSSLAASRCIFHFFICVSSIKVISMLQKTFNQRISKTLTLKISSHQLTQTSSSNC